MRVGIDLGGTKIEGIVIDNAGEALYRHRIATPRGNYTAIVDAIKQLVLALEQQAGQRCSVGIGGPGSLNSKGLLRNSNTVELNGRAFLKDMESVLDRTIRMANDANCFALSEAIDGAGAGAKSVFGVILGTGVGGGLVLEGKLLQGHNHIAGEWGHNPLPWPVGDELPGPLCYCDKRACIETFLSGPGLAADHFQHTGQTMTAIEIAQSESADCQASLSRYEDRLARALASVINIFDPEVIVLGGGLSRVERWYHNLPLRLRDYAFTDELNTRVVAPRFGDSSGVRGAAWLW